MEMRAVNSYGQGSKSWEEVARNAMADRADLIRENGELKKFAAGLEMNLAAVIQRAEAAEAKLAEAQKDTARLDWLEGELARESAAYYDHAMGSRPPVPALFRRNVPITRAAIDAARLPK